MQCDDAVRSETFLSDRARWTGMPAALCCRAAGGTDFRPAFARIAELRGEGKLQELQGVLYFTDGKGTYPARRQPYEVAFLFLDTGEPPPGGPALGHAAGD